MRIALVLIGVFATILGVTSTARTLNTLTNFGGNTGIVNNQPLHQRPLNLSGSKVTKNTGGKSKSFFGVPVHWLKSIVIIFTLATGSMIPQTNFESNFETNFVVIRDPKDNFHMRQFNQKTFQCGKVNDHFECKGKIEDLDHEGKFQLAREIEGNEKQLVIIGDIKPDSCAIGTFDKPDPEEPPTCTQIIEEEDGGKIDLTPEESKDIFHETDDPFEENGLTKTDIDHDQIFYDSVDNLNDLVKPDVVHEHVHMPMPGEQPIEYQQTLKINRSNKNIVPMNDAEQRENKVKQFLGFKHQDLLNPNEHKKYADILKTLEDHKHGSLVAKYQEYLEEKKKNQNKNGGNRRLLSDSEIDKVKEFEKMKKSGLFDTLRNIHPQINPVGRKLLRAKSMGNYNLYKLQKDKEDEEKAKIRNIELKQNKTNDLVGDYKRKMKQTEEAKKQKREQNLEKFRNIHTKTNPTGRNLLRTESKNDYSLYKLQKDNADKEKAELRNNELRQNNTTDAVMMDYEDYENEMNKVEKPKKQEGYENLEINEKEKKEVEGRTKMYLNEAMLY